MLFKKLIISFIVSLSLFCSVNSLYALQLIPGGQSIGISLDYDGVLITGGYDIDYNNELYNPLKDNLQVGDIIESIENNTITTIEELSNSISKNINQDQQINIKVNRDDNVINTYLKIDYDNNSFNTGLYVKDKLSGVGTITYYNPADSSFGSLGHPLIDEDNNLLKNGSIYESTVTGIIKNSDDRVGQKNATIDNVKIGLVSNNNSYGVYGNYTCDVNEETMSTASIDEVELGEAYFKTTLDSNVVVDCKINITDLQPQETSKEKGITFELIDKEIIKKTNGIVQGMSGSPIIQNNKIIGCVTHVNKSNGLIGYGLYIDWMLEKGQ